MVGAAGRRNVYSVCNSIVSSSRGSDVFSHYGEMQINHMHLRDNIWSDGSVSNIWAKSTPAKTSIVRIRGNTKYLSKMKYSYLFRV